MYVYTYFVFAEQICMYAVYRYVCMMFTCVDESTAPCVHICICNVCVCVCCMNTSPCILQIHIHVRATVCTHVCIYIYILLCIYIYKLLCIYAYIHVRVCHYMYMYTCVCIRTHISQLKGVGGHCFDEHHEHHSVTWGLNVKVVK